MPKARVYDSATSQWIYLDAKNADTVGGKAASDFALAGHNHDDRYYTETESDNRFAPLSHNHDTSYYTKTQLNTTGTANAVHWDNIGSKPSTFTPSIHNHDDRYYTETESDAKYLQKSDNLNSLSDKAAARTNLGLGTMATESTSSYALSTHNHDGVYVKGDYRLTISATAPASPTTKDVWLDISTATAPKLKSWNGTAWVISDAKDADTVDGAHAGTAANNVLKLDSNAKVPIGNLPAASTSAVGGVQLTDSTSSTSTTTAATPNSVKSAYDLANGKYAKPAAGIPKTDLDSAVQSSLDKADGALSTSGGTVSGSANFTAGLGVSGVLNTSGIIEHGSVTAPNTPFIDFHSSGNNIDYDSRIIASGGNATIGQGALEYTAAAGHTFNGKVKIASAFILPVGANMYAT